ncbi:MAG: hypothetical protein WCK65_13990 [Rhodospirillaceae bacterium]
MSGLGAHFATTAAPLGWVVFCDNLELKWLRILRPGFRHCFVVLNDGRHWIAIDPLAPLLEVTVPPVPASYDLPGWFASQEYTVVAAPVRRSLRQPAPWGPFTCVETCKRVLGLHDCLLVTPWQLFRHLTRAGENKVTNTPPLPLTA